MKKLSYLFALLALAWGFSSCTHDSDEDTYVTHYINFNLTGGTTYQHTVNTPYTDPGYAAYEGTEDVTAQVEVGGDQVDATTPGVYNVTYSAVNKDGFSASITRTVIVCDPTQTADFSGTYTTESGTQRVSSRTTPYSGTTVTLTKAGPGIYRCNDEIGGYYAQLVYSDYPNLFNALSVQGYLEITDDGAIKLLSGYNSQWDTSADALTGQVAQDGSITWDCSWNGMSFHLVLSKN